MSHHICIFNKKRYGRDYIDLILKGKKIIDVKFGINKVSPYNKLIEGDTVYLKESGGPLLGYIKVGKVKFIDIKNPKQIDNIFRANKGKLAISSNSELENLIKSFRHYRYCTVFEILKPIKFKKPISYSSSGRSGWISKIPMNNRQKDYI